MASQALVATPDTCAHCFDTIASKLGLGFGSNSSGSGSGSSSSSSSSSAAAKTPVADRWSIPRDAACPMFVTWNKHDDKDAKHQRRRQAQERKYSLRGCIGTFASRPLLSGLTDYAQISAFEDSRFRPITRAELPSLQCCVSLLTNFETADGPHDWTVGKHGIQIEFRDDDGASSKPGKRHTATYLPEVASAQGWDHATTLRHLVKKSGYKGPVARALASPSFKLTRYQSSKSSLTYEKYQEMVVYRSAAVTAAGDDADDGKDADSSPSKKMKT